MIPDARSGDVPRMYSAALDGEGENAAFDVKRLRAMFDAHFDSVWRALRRLGLSPDLADDGAQRVFLVASKRLGDIELGRERAFLLKSAVHVAAKERRAVARRREVLDEEALDAPGGGPGPDELLDQRRARELLERLLDRLPEELRTVLVLFEFEGLSVDEIAEALDLPRGTAASRLRRAREAFQEAIVRWKARASRGGQ